MVYSSFDKGRRSVKELCTPCIPSPYSGAGARGEDTCLEEDEEEEEEEDVIGPRVGLEEEEEEEEALWF